MPGGGPHGTILGMFSFIILINDAEFSIQNKEFGKKVTTVMNKRKEIPYDHWKYVDNLTLAEALYLKEQLKVDSEETLVKPLTYHSRTEHILPPPSSKVQAQLDELLDYAETNEMKINEKKTKVMLFNSAIKRDFTPELKLRDKTPDLVEKFKLLGVKVTSEVKWNENTSNITKKGFARLWMMRRLKQAIRSQ